LTNSIRGLNSWNMKDDTYLDSLSLTRTYE
jgi:hypothetical protein